MLAVLTIVAILRGNGETPSVAGIRKCDSLDWVLLSILIITALFCSIYGIQCVLKPEYEKKK
jgi:hypothetical protein